MIELYVILYFVVGTALAVVSSRRLTVHDQAHALVLFWPVFSVIAFLSIFFRSVEGFIKLSVLLIKSRQKRG